MPFTAIFYLSLDTIICSKSRKREIVRNVTETPTLAAIWTLDTYVVQEAAVLNLFRRSLLSDLVDMNITSVGTTNL